MRDFLEIMQWEPSRVACIERLSAFLLSDDGRDFAEEWIRATLDVVVRMHGREERRRRLLEHARADIRRELKPAAKRANPRHNQLDELRNANEENERRRVLHQMTGDLKEVTR